jgi:hypothetical protein
LNELKRASVGASWELVGGAATLDELDHQVAEFEPDVVVLEPSLGAGAVDLVRAHRPTARVVSVGPLPGAHATVADAAEVRDAILGLSPPGGPVRI